MLIGRERELQQAVQLVESARGGPGGALVVVGHAGIGKTAFLDEIRRLTPDVTQISATGVESEVELPYGGLHELLHPIQELFGRLPKRQGRALRAALALEEGEPTALEVNAAVVSLLVEAAATGPLLMVVDDAHALDRASAGAIAFAARRVVGESIAVLVASRPPLGVEFEPMATMELAPLAVADARRLLSARREPVATDSVGRFLELASGYPLAILEMPASLANDLPSSSGPIDRLRLAFLGRIERLAEPARLALLVAAAEPDSGTATHALTALGLTNELDGLESAGLLRIDGPGIAFRHPLIRSLAYASAGAADRRRVHGALADATAADDDDRRAWHLGAATHGPDEAAARGLEQTAERAGARGGYAAQARALERAAKLSPRPEDMARRGYAASRAAFWAGDTRHALTLAEAALPLTTDPLLRADLLVQVGAIGQWAGASVNDAAYLSAIDADGLDSERISKLLYEIVKLRLDAFDADGALPYARRLEHVARDAGPWWGPRHLAGAAAAYLLAGARDDATALFRELLAEPAIPSGYAYDYLSLEWYEELEASLDATLREGRANGHQLRIVWNQACGAHLMVRIGRLDKAASAAAEAISLGDVIDTPALVGSARGALAMVQAWRGQGTACRENAREAIAAARIAGDRYQDALARQALGLLALGEGRAEDAVVELLPVATQWAQSSVVDPASVPSLPDLIEALVRAGDTAEAATWIDRFARVALPAGGALAPGRLARCQALLAAGDESIPMLERSLELLSGRPLPLERARTQLALGERLRRGGDKRGARIHLLAAHETFSAAAAQPWAQRSADELRATGVSVQGDGRGPLPELTAQEIRIASLVAEGRTNRQIAAELYLSPKTVEYHLAGTFRRLNIRSRAELARIVAASGNGAAHR